MAEPLFFSPTRMLWNNPRLFNNFQVWCWKPMQANSTTHLASIFLSKNVQNCDKWQPWCYLAHFFILKGKIVRPFCIQKLGQMPLFGNIYKRMKLRMALYSKGQTHPCSTKRMRPRSLYASHCVFMPKRRFLCRKPIRLYVQVLCPNCGCWETFF